eukprot:PITA_07844
MDFVVHGPDVQEFKHQKRYPSLERSIKHYSNFHQILLVGEGDFSFSLALANAFGSAENMVPTSIDSRERVLSSYKTAHITLSKLESLGATILHRVDATKMEKHHIIGKRSFDRIVYNFPHAGFYGQEKDKAVIKRHRHLMKDFFKNASTVLSTMGEIHVTHKSHPPYDKWKLVKQAEKHRLLLKESVHFSIADYPGYVNRRGAGNHAGKPFLLGECRTHKFILSPAILHQRELMAKAAVSTDLFPQLSIENFMAVLMELKSERKAREDDEKAKADLEASLNDLKKIADDNTEKRADLTRQRNNAVHQKAQAWREKENIEKQLAEALKSNKEEIKRKESKFEEAILEIEFEKQARKMIETAKTDLEMLLEKEKKENDELKRQRDEVLYQKEEICREKTDITKQLGEALAAIEELERQARPLKRQRRVWRAGSIA